MAGHQHATVKPSFWNGKTGKQLRTNRDAQALALYLMTSPHRTMAGLYYLPKLYIEHEMGLGGADLDKALERLAELDFAHYDEEAELVFVVNLTGHQVGEKLKGGDKPDRRIAFIEKMLSPYHGHPFYGLWLARYGEGYHQNMESLGGASEGAYTPRVPAPALVPDFGSDRARNLEPEPLPRSHDATDEIRTPEAYARVYREATGNTDLHDVSPSWDRDQLAAYRQMRDWCGRDLAKLRREFEALASEADDWLRGQPVHVWAKRLGTARHSVASVLRLRPGQITKSSTGTMADPDCF